MFGQLEIRIVKESVIHEIERLYTPEKKNHFKAIAQSIQSDSSLSFLFIRLDKNEYVHLIKSIKRFQNPDSDYYQHSSSILKDLLNLQEARIWTKKETMEINEALMESFDEHAQSVFSPYLTKVEQGQIFILMVENDITSQDNS